MKWIAISELDYSEVILEDEHPYEEDYQMIMLQENKLERVLPIRGRGMGEHSQFLYRTSNLKSMEKKFEKETITYQQIQELLVQILYVVSQVREYLLDVNRILLSPESIFYKEGCCFFCYYPNGRENCLIAFHKLTEYIIERIDYSDANCVLLAGELHKETMNTTYNLELLLKKVGRDVPENVQEESEQKVEEPRKEQEAWVHTFEESTEEESIWRDDWIEGTDERKFLTIHIDRMRKKLPRMIQKVRERSSYGK